MAGRRCSLFTPLLQHGTRGLVRRTGRALTRIAARLLKSLRTLGGPQARPSATQCLQVSEPAVADLHGCLRGSWLDERDYRAHLLSKHT